MLHWFIGTLAYLITVATPILHKYGLFALVGILFITFNQLKTLVFMPVFF